MFFFEKFNEFGQEGRKENTCRYAMYMFAVYIAHFHVKTKCEVMNKVILISFFVEEKNTHVIFSFFSLSFQPFSLSPRSRASVHYGCVHSLHFTYTFPVPICSCLTRTCDLYTHSLCSRFVGNCVKKCMSLSYRSCVMKRNWNR